MTEALLMQEMKAESPCKASARLPGIESRLAWAGGLRELAAQRKPLAAQPPLVQRQAQPEEEEQIQTKGCSGLIQREATPEEEEEIQTKLVVGPPDDEYEREADLVAEQVVSMPEPKVQRACPKCEEEEAVQTKPLAGQITPLVQRQMGSVEEEKMQSKPLAGQIADPVQLGSKTEEDKSSLMRIKCDKCPKKRLLHRLGIANQSNDSSIVHEVLRSPGQPLDPLLREFMEQRFGHGSSRAALCSVRSNTSPVNLKISPAKGRDNEVKQTTDGIMHNPLLRTRIQPVFAPADFGNVRIHSDNKAAESAQAVNALAYTVGRNIVFGEGQYAPATITGRRLIAHELTHVVQQMSSGSPRRYRNISSDSGTSGDFVQRNGAPKPTSENVWGFLVTRRMCGCISDVRDSIAWANTAGATYAACDNPANPTGSDVERCFDKAHPGSAPIAVTSSSGIMTLPPPSADPCEKIENKATFVHETMHSRHTDSIASSLGPAFFAEWRRLAGDPDRLEKLRGRFPAQVTAFETRWNDGHDWAQDEVNSYRWERRFLEDTLAALNRIC